MVGVVITVVQLPHYAPSNPELDLSHTVSTDNLLYGTEYKGNEFGTNSNGEDMPCAVWVSSKYAINTVK
jgi:hypothetical protein